MLMKSFLVGSVLAWSLPLALEAASQPTPAPMAPAFLTAQASHPTPQPSPTAAPTLYPTPVLASATAPMVSPTVQPLIATPAALSGTTTALTATADADGDSVVAEEVGEDGQLAAKTTSPDLSKLDSETLASLAGGVDSDTQTLFFDPKTKQGLSEAMPGAWRVSVDSLYYELARRNQADNKDKPVRQAFALALFKDPERAKDAKDLAFDDYSAEVVIGQLEGGRASARMDLQKLAEKGNRKARLYLGLDKPVARETATALTGTAVAAGNSPSAAVSAPLTVSGAAVTSSPAPLSPSAANPVATPTTTTPLPSPQK